MNYNKLMETTALATVAAVAFGATNVVAADLLTENADPSAIESSDIWSGLYVGLEMNAMGGTLPQRSNGSDDSYYDMAGSYAPGIFMGINKQIGNIVLGAELSVLVGAQVGDPSDGNTYGDNWGVYNISHLVDATARVGFAFDNILVYGTAGASTGNVVAQYGHNYSTWGVNYGAGVDLKVDENLSVGLQYEARNLTGYNTDQGELQEFNTSTMSLRAAYSF